jgi:outer membrane protein assembly factor BamB
MKTRSSILAASILVTLFGVVSRADDWPMYGRDATRNAVSPEKNPPFDWQIEEKDDAGKITSAEKNVRWKAELGSTTFGSPVVSGGLVWVCTNTWRPGDDWAKPEKGCLVCFNERDGKLRWRYLTPRSGGRFFDGPGSVGSTPMVEGDRLWFITNEWEVVCLDIGPLLKNTGEPREVWKIDMPRDLKVSAVSSVMGPSLRCQIGASYKGMIYVMTGDGVDVTRKHVPAPDSPSLVCLEKNTGKVVWQDSSPGENILWGQWSSPLVAEINGRAQVIAPEGDSWVRSFDAMTGKLIWSFDANPKGSIYPMTRNLLIAVPVLYENRVYVATGQDPEHSTGRGILWCIDPTREGDVSEELDDGPMPDTRRAPSLPGGPRKGKPNPKSGVVWKFDQVDRQAKRPAEKDQMNRTIGSVAAADGLVIATDYAGFVHCLDARTGKQQWAHDLEAETRGSPLICDGKIYVGTHDGEVRILALAREEKLLATRGFSSPIYCSPILANGTLYVTTQSTLYAIRESTAPPANSGAGAGEWPQWRGPDRTNISRDTGLLSKWPGEGPPLLWKAQGLGEGVPPVAVARQVVYTLGYHDGSEFLTALDAATGDKIWDASVGPAVQEMANMRWLSQRTPTVDDERIYVMRARGELVCLSIPGGKELWRKNYITDFEGKSGSWGYCDFPLVDGDSLICTPGGKSGAVVALDKRSGALLWKCAIPDAVRSTYSTVIVAEIGGVRQYIQQFDTVAAGISTRGNCCGRPVPSAPPRATSILRSSAATPSSVPGGGFVETR